MIVKARECDKAKGTFVEGLLSFVHEGRIHADINYICFVSTSLSISMSNPNLQQIPSKGIIGKKMRELFVPDEGCVWGSFDYSQQEPRIVVHYALTLYPYKNPDIEMPINLIESLETDRRSIQGP